MDKETYKYMRDKVRKAEELGDRIAVINILKLNITEAFLSHHELTIRIYFPYLETWKDVSLTHQVARDMVINALDVELKSLEEELVNL